MIITVITKSAAVYILTLTRPNKAGYKTNIAVARLIILHCVPKNVHLFSFQITPSKINHFNDFGVLNPEKI